MTIMMELLKPFVHHIKIYKKDAKLIDVQGKRKPLQCCIKSQKEQLLCENRGKSSHTKSSVYRRIWPLTVAVRLQL